MNIKLSAHEARVIGALIEKQITTPDQYPLSLNALVNACNQKNNRDPVLSLSEPEVQAVVDGLAKRHLVVERSGFGSRVPKYQQLFCNTEFGSLKFTAQETAIVCELLLRGPQMPGELRSRAARMAPLADVNEVEATLERLASRSEGAIVVRLAREAGRRESRYAHLFGDTPIDTTPTPPLARAAAPASTVPAPSTDLLARIEALETEVRELRAELAALLDGRPA